MHDGMDLAKRVMQAAGADLEVLLTKVCLLMYGPEVRHDPYFQSMLTNAILLDQDILVMRSEPNLTLPRHLARIVAYVVDYDEDPQVMAHGVRDALVKLAARNEKAPAGR